MRRSFCLAFAMLFFTAAQAQPAFTRAAGDAFLVTRMAGKFHLQPKPLDNAFSAFAFDKILNELDPDKIFLLAEDTKMLLPYRLQLDDEVLLRKTVFLQQLSSVYEKRLKQTDSIISEAARSPFDFTAQEKLPVGEDTNYAANTAALKIKIKKLLKAGVLDALLDELEAVPPMTAQRQKKFTDSLEVIYRKKIQSVYRRQIKKQLESPGGIPAELGELYCETVANYYDPHTSYFSVTGKENFEAALGQKAMVFGFSLDENEDGHVIIAKLKPGSPAFQSGQLNEGDRIEAIQWEGQSLIDLADASLREVADIISASNHDKAKFIIRKPDGSMREVVLTKAQMDDDSEAERVKSFILKGTKSVGYISLPAFYSDWENSDNNVNGCANDVAREVLKLKKENIDALVLDLRYNGGGSVREAVDLAGIFIDAGPVAMEKGRDAKVYTLKDANRGTIYDGPLFIMVNGYSASASELVAGTLQDYHRAVIMGSTTYGKATSQAMLPMDTAISLEKDFSRKEASSYIKLTLDKLYRVNGTTAQFSGVQPDIVLPDAIDAGSQRESNEPFAIPATGIEANKYYQPLPPLKTDLLRTVAKNYIDTSAYFKTLVQYISYRKASPAHTDIPLNWNEAMQLRKKPVPGAPDFSSNKSRVFTVANHQYQEQRIRANKDLQETNNAWKSFLEKDPYLQVTYLAAIQSIKN